MHIIFFIQYHTSSKKKINSLKSAAVHPIFYYAQLNISSSKSSSKLSNTFHFNDEHIFLHLYDWISLEWGLLLPRKAIASWETGSYIIFQYSNGTGIAFFESYIRYRGSFMLLAFVYRKSSCVPTNTSILRLRLKRSQNWLNNLYLILKLNICVQSE